jgi:SnoaL-like domain
MSVVAYAKHCEGHLEGVSFQPHAFADENVMCGRSRPVNFLPLTVGESITLTNMPDRHSLPKGTWPEKAIRNNGPNDLALERYKIRELAEGWPLYRFVPTLSDHCEWENFESLFHPDAYVYATWTRRTAIADFIKTSKGNGQRCVHNALNPRDERRPTGESRRR